MDFKKDDMIKYVKYIPWVLLVIAAIVFIRQCGQEPEKEYVTIEKEVLIESVEKQFDTIYEPKPYPVKVVEIDSSYYEEYKKLKDSVAKDSMFKEAIKINEYNQVFEDTLQTIDVYSKTRGNLLEQSVKYTTKPYYITVKDSIEIKTKIKVSLGAEIGIPLNFTPDFKPVAKGNLYITNRKDNSIILSADTEGRLWLGYNWKLRFRKK